jgi:hypothetical protein
VSSESTSKCLVISEGQVNCLQGRTGVVTPGESAHPSDSVARGEIRLRRSEAARACAVSAEMSFR